MILDVLGRELQLDAPPRRVVSLSPGLTDFLVAVGAGGLLVGASDYCELPPEVAGSVARLGGPSNPDLDALRALRPDLVLAARDETSAAAQIEAAGLPVYQTAVRSVGDALAQLAALARALGPAADAGAAQLLAGIREAQEQAYAAQGTRPMRRALAFTWRDPWVAVGGDTYADDLLRLCGAENLALRLAGRSPRAGLDAFMRHNPQVILLAADPYPFAPADINAFWPYGDVTAVARRRVHLIDGRLLTRYGARTAEAIRTLSALLHAP